MPAGTVPNPFRVCCACPFGGGHQARPVGRWANGRRLGVPAYVPAALVPPGRRFWALGANPGVEDGPVNDDKENTR